MTVPSFSQIKSHPLSVTAFLNLFCQLQAQQVCQVVCSTPILNISKSVPWGHLNLNDIQTRTCVSCNCTIVRNSKYLHKLSITCTACLLLKMPFQTLYKGPSLLLLNSVEPTTTCLIILTWSSQPQ